MMEKPLQGHVVVITGASSGIGRITAFKFAARGASVVLGARNENALTAVAREIEELGGQAHVVITDVANYQAVEHLASEAINRFGRIDTWVNNASVALYASVEQSSIEEIERIIQVNLMGTIYGSKAALPYMRQQGSGSIINISSVLGQRAIPLQAAYCAAKHGVKGFSESLRLELAHERSNIRVTTIYPASINTPFFNHARSKMGVLPKPIPPVYEPEVVADAILYAALHPKREVYVGGASKFFTLMEYFAPSITDWFMLQNGMMWKQQKTDRPDDGRDNLFKPDHEIGSIRGEFGKGAAPTSPYTRLLELSRWRRLLVIPAAVGLTAFLRQRAKPKPQPTNDLKQAFDRVKHSLEKIAS
jgi:short-subunit dehydrogenase